MKVRSGKMNNVKRSISIKQVGALIVFIAFGLAGGAWASYDHQSNNANSVRVDVVPVQLNSGKQAKCEIRMNTHSVPLDYDMAAVSLLKDDQGREYRASVWNGSPAVGHHRSGVLEFPAIGKDAKSITLYIKNIAGVPERTFEWKLEQ
jgi:hypothetical protein